MVGFSLVQVAASGAYRVTTASSSWGAFLALSFLSTLAGCTTACGWSETSELSSSRGRSESANRDVAVLVVSNEGVDFGIVPQGGHQRAYFEVINPSAAPVEIHQVETTCDCLEVTLTNSRIDTGGKILACANLDLGQAAHFVGDLEIQIKGLTGSDETGFSLTVHADVRPRAEFAGLKIEAPTGPSDLPQAEPIAMPHVTVIEQ